MAKKISVHLDRRVPPELLSDDGFVTDRRRKLRDLVMRGVLHPLPTDGLGEGAPAPRLHTDARGPFRRVREVELERVCRRRR